MDAAQPVVLVAHELVAGVDIPLRGDGHVLAARAAAPQPLDHAGPLGQIHIEMEKVGLRVILQVLGQALILRLQLGQILLLERIGVFPLPHHRLHRHVPADGRQGLHVLSEVLVEAGEGAPQVVVLGAPAGDELLKLGDDHVVAALAVDGGPQIVVDLLPAVQGQHGVGHLPVDVLDVLVIEEHAVGGDRKAEALVVLLLHGAGVLHRLLHRVHGHERLPAEEVHLDVAPVAGLLDHKVDGLLGGLKVHGHAVAGAEVAGTREAVLAPQVTVVGHMEAQGLHQGLLLHGRGLLPVDVVVLLKEQALLRQAAQLLPRLLQGGGVVLGQPGRHLRRAVLPHGGLHQLQQVVGQLVQHMDGAAVHIHGDVHAEALKGMYHICSFLT